MGYGAILKGIAKVMVIAASAVMVMNLMMNDMAIAETVMKPMLMEPMVLKQIRMVMKTLDLKILLSLVPKKDSLLNLPNVSFSYPYV